MTDETTGPGPSSEFGYTAFEKWSYNSFITVLPDEKTWIDYGDSFYRASVILIDKLADDTIDSDVEGLAAMLLFRHYVELALKTIIVRGRRLVDRQTNIVGDVQNVANIHDLDVLWKLVLKDAKPKIEDSVWNNYDIPFVEQCILEFHARDQKGFALRYPKQGGERYEFDFVWFRKTMEHVNHVLGDITAYLIGQYGENQEWEDIQNSY
jgi:hypothetical protein